MRNFLMTTALLFVAAPAFAADVTKDMQLGTSKAEVATKLEAMGYQIRKSDMEDGQIEFYAVKDKTMVELYVSPQTGKVTKLKTK